MFSIFNKSTCALLITLASSSFVQADEVKRLAGLSKAAFIKEYEIKFAETVRLNRVLIERFDPKFSNDIMKEGPLLDKERAAIECSYDLMAEAGALEDLAKQVQLYTVLERMVSENPKLDFVDLMMNPEVVEGYTADVTDNLMEAFVACKYSQASTERVNLSPEFWEALAVAAKERGYNQ